MLHDACRCSPTAQAEIKLAIEDITERKRAEEEALRSAEKLASAGRIAATIAHEINNPLDILSNVMYLLGQRSTLDEGSRDLVTLAKEEVKRVTTITKQTLGLFSNSSQVQEVALSKQLEKSCCRRQSAEKNIAVNILLRLSEFHDAPII